MRAERPWTKIAGLWLALVSVCLLWGCRDNPQDTAAKSIQETTLEVLASADGIAIGKVTAEELRGRIEAALRSNQPGGMIQDAAILSGANLSFLEIRQACANIRLDRAGLDQSLDRLCAQIRRLGQIKIKAQRIEQLLAVNNKEIAEISEWIGADEQPDSLSGRLVLAQQNVQKLLAEKAELETKKAQAQQDLAEVQAGAEEKIRLSEQAQGAKQQALQKEGFDLLLEKKPLYLSMQETVNKLEAIDGQLAIDEPAAVRLEKDLATARKQLDDLKNSPSLGQLVSQRESLGQEYAGGNKEVEQSAAALGAQVAQYSKQSTDIAAEVDELTAEYQKIRSRGLEPTVSLLLGEAYLQAGLVCSGLVAAGMDLGTKLEEIADANSLSGLEKLKDLVRTDSKPDKELVGKTMEYFDKSDQSYEKAFSFAAQLGKSAQCSALKGQILAVNSKIRLSDRVGDYESADAAQNRLNGLFEKGKEFGTLFSRSETAALIQQGLGYKPFLPVDMSMALEAIKTEFGQWRRLRGSQQEEAVNGLLTRVGELAGKYSNEQEIAAFLETERTALEEAKKRGFAEPESVEVTDANSL